MHRLEWTGISRRKPQFTRYRTIDGDYALRIMCWHGVQGDLVWVDKETVSNWEFYARLAPCKWVSGCPDFAWWQGTEQRRAEALKQPYQDLVPPHRRTVAAERKRRREEMK